MLMFYIFNNNTKKNKINKDGGKNKNVQKLTKFQMNKRTNTEAGNKTQVTFFFFK